MIDKTDIIPSDTRYLPLTQQRWCCVPACIQIIMLRHSIPLVPAELLGYHLGLTVPEEELQYFWRGRTGKKPHAGWGTQIKKEEYSPNVVFERLGIPLRVGLKLISTFPDYDAVKDYLNETINRDKDVLVCFDSHVLYGTEYQGGHVCVVDKADGEKVRLIDTLYKAPKWREVALKKLYEAMKVHGDEKSGGFWEIEKI